MSKYGDLPERGKITMAVNVFGINIQSADTKLPQQEATYRTMTKGKKGQNKQTVISNTAQWPKEKQDKMTNRDQQYSSLFVYFVLSFLLSLCCFADHCLSILSFFSFGHCAVLLIIQHNDQRKNRTK
jgi:hypothetical protein